MLLLLVLCCGVIFAQSTVTGKVTDEMGEPIPNASVIVKGLNIGTMTKEDGTFTINVPENGKVLIISGVGKAPMEVTIRDRSTIDVQLKDEDSELDEVVVVGYGVQNRKEITGNIVSIKGAAVADKPVQSFESALAGRAAGVQITVPNGVLNSTPVFRIRGTNSINLSSQPLIVIDGVVVFTGDAGSSLASTNALSNLNPSDIESMDILKDAAATAIYGSRAANGVVVITTKKGKKGQAKLTYDGWVGSTKAMRLWEILDAEEYMTIKNEGRRNLGLSDTYLPDQDAQGNLINTNWLDVIYRTGTSHNHNVNVSGANDRTSYYFSAGYTEQEGIVRGNDFDRKTIRLNADHKATNWLNFGINASYANELNKTSINTGADGGSFASAGAARLALALPPNVAPYNNDGSYNLNGPALGRGKNLENITFYNPVPILDLNYSTTEQNRFMGSAYVIVKPIKNITLKSNFGIDYLTTTSKNFYTPLAGDGYSVNGSSFAISNNNKRHTFTNTAQYDNVFNGVHSFSALIGSESQKSVNESFGLSRSNISDDFFTTIQGGWSINNPTGVGQGENFLASYFGRINYDYDKKYFLSGVIRRDGYSAFAPGKKWGNFYSVSAAWDIAKESFFSDGKLGEIFTSLKLRGSYGTTGNISGIPNFAHYTFFSGTGLYNGNPTLTFSQAGNPNLTWETSKKTDFGLTFGILNDRISGEIAYYRNDIDGLLLRVPNTLSVGMPNSVLFNIGEMYNKGIEITLNATVITGKDFTWNTSFNFTSNKNEVVSLAEGVDNIITATSLETASITMPGYSLGMTYVIETRGVDPQTGRRIVVNENGRELLYDHSATAGQRYTYRDNGQVAPNLNTSLAQKVWKNTLPKYYGGFDNNFRYKNFDLNILLTYQLGFYVYNGTRATILDQRFWNSSKEALNRWQKPGDVTTVPRLVYGDNTSNGSAYAISDNVEKGDFLKFRNISLGYTIPSPMLSKLKLSNARVYFSAQNPFIITKYTGPDPETSTNGTSNTSQGVDRNGVGNARVLTVGLNVGF